MAAWHTLWGGGTGEHPDPSGGHEHSARAVPRLPARLQPSPALELLPLSEDTARQVSDRLLAADFDAWSAALARVGNCAHPIRLSGHSETVDLATGEVVAGYTSTSERLGVTHVRCGNRRVSECPSCSRVYAGDIFDLIRAGVTGGKGVPDTAADNPRVSMTQDAYLGRRAGNAGNLAALEAYNPDLAPRPVSGEDGGRSAAFVPAFVPWEVPRGERASG